MAGVKKVLQTNAGPAQKKSKVKPAAALKNLTKKNLNTIHETCDATSSVIFRDGDAAKQREIAERIQRAQANLQKAEKMITDDESQMKFKASLILYSIGTAGLY